MADIVFGKHVLESLSTGMYSDPMTIYREYIQNSTDAIDKAISIGLIAQDEGKIHITVNQHKRYIAIKDNGTGVNADSVYNTLLDIANSQKDYRENRGFRGIGRLGGLGYSKKLLFVTSAKGENVKSTVEWDGDKFLKMLNVDNKDIVTAVEVIEKSTSIKHEEEDADKHYFEVILEGVYSQFDELIDEQNVDYYLATVAPVHFDAQMFIHAQRINPEYETKRKPIECYNIFLNKRAKPIYKQYRTNFNTGHQERTKKKDYIQDIAFFEERMENGELLYLGWYAITNFYGSVSNEYMRGIRIRKGNILVGGENTFSRFFPSEGDAANKWFIGEVYVYDPHVLPNAKRDDFERNEAYERLSKSLTVHADRINREHRRLMSDYHSRIKSVETILTKRQSILSEINDGKVNSESKRENLLKELKEVETRLKKDQKELEKIVVKEALKDSYRSTASKLLNQTEKAEKDIVEIENIIVNAETATKYDLDSSYSRDERKLYHKIVESIYSFFKEDMQTADKLKQKILDDLKVKKKT